ncbi:hypothetical protein KA005_78250, partial [bacterium]|nr:hypothetical protein [bacterium]
MDRRKAVQDIIESCLAEFLGQDQIEGMVDFLLKTGERKPNLPLRNQLAVIAHGTPKTAALCFDRVWDRDPRWGVPAPIGFYGGTVEESIILTLDRLMELMLFRMEDSNKEVSERAEAILAKIYPYFLKVIGIKNREDVPDLVGTGCRFLSDALFDNYRLNVPISYTSIKDRDMEFQRGDYSVLSSCFTNLTIVDEEALEWEQVIEFRMDEEARKKYRRLTHWLNKEMLGKPREFIEDEIAIKLEDYTLALKKHGLKTLVGSLSVTFDHRALIASSATAAGMAYAGHDILGILAAAGVIVGK